MRREDGGREVRRVEGNMKMKFVLALILASFVLAPAAFAGGGSAGTGYGGEGGNVQQQVSGAAAEKGGLPFTGLDLALLVVGGAVMVVAGAALRRAAKRPT